MAESIEVTVSPKGEVKIEAKGYNGQNCLKATAPLEKALGSVKKRSMKLEAADPIKVEDKVKIGQ